MTTTTEQKRIIGEIIDALMKAHTLMERHVDFINADPSLVNDLEELGGEIQMNLILGNGFDHEDFA